MDDSTEIMSEKESQRIYTDVSKLIPVKSSIPFSPTQLKGDLDNIILTALRKEPNLRYESVEQFSKDISNYLNGLPVSARPNTFFYRASKFYGRNKTATIIGSLLIISLIAGVITTTWQYFVANQQRERAEKRFQDVRKLSNSLLFEITPKIERLNGSTEAREILVKRALEYLDSLAADSQNDINLQSELASAYEKIGELQGNSSRPNLGDFTGATESLIKANKIRQNLPKTTENLRLLAENHRILADIRYEQNDAENAHQDNLEAIRLYKDLVTQNPDSKELQISYTKSLTDLAQFYLFTWKLDKSIEVSKQISEEITKLDRNEKDIQEIIITNHTDLSYALSWNERQKEAEEEMAKAIELSESLGLKYPNDVRTQRVVWRTYMQTSAIYETIKDDISLKFALKALDSAIQAVQNDSADYQAKHNLVRSHFRAAICYANLKKYPESYSSLLKAETILMELIEREPRNQIYQVELARIYTNFGETKLKNNLFDEALKSFQKSISIREKLLQTNAYNTNISRDLAVTIKNVGDINSKLNEKDKAKINYEKSFEILSQLKNNNTLSEVDNKLIDEVKNKLAEIK